MATLLVSVLVVTKDAGHLLPRCLTALKNFAEVIVIDTPSNDGTAQIAAQHGACYIPFTWNGRYPKKRQWLLDNIDTQHDWLFFVDADEVVTPELINEIGDTINATQHSAFFIKGRPVYNNTALRHGRWHNKISLFRKSTLRFPELDDTDTAMGEIEGHYQPIVTGTVGQLKHPLLHYSHDDPAEWQQRHERYADWQAAIETCGIKTSASETRYRRILKNLFNTLPLRPTIAFLDSYLLQLGFLDGYNGFVYAQSRYHYYRMIDLRKKR